MKTSFRKSYFRINKVLVLSIKHNWIFMFGGKKLDEKQMFEKKIKLFIYGFI